MPKLTHSDLINLGFKLNYPLDKEGLCHGFSCMLMQAILANDEATFWQRLHLMEDYKNDFSLLKKKIDEIRLKIKNNRQLELTEEEWALLEIRAFYAGVAVYLLPHKFQDLLDKTDVSQPSIVDIYPLIHPTSSGEKSLSIPLNKNYGGSKDDLVNYINDLEKALSNHSNIPIIINNLTHSILIKYNSKNAKKPWTYVDTKDFKRNPQNKEYYRELNTEELVNSLFVSFGDAKSLVFNMKLVTHSTHPINQDAALKQFDLSYRLNKQHTTIYDKNWVGMLHIACQNGNVEDVASLLEKGSKLNDLTKSEITPLLIACQYGHIELVQFLLAQKKIKINKSMENGATALFVACQFGCLEVVKLLLAQKGIEVDKAKTETQDRPLHIACKEGYSAIVILLLQTNKTDLAHKNKKGETALDIAFSQKNNAIIEILLMHAQKNSLSLSKLMSTETLAKACEWAANKATRSNDFFESSQLPELKNFVQEKLGSLGSATKIKPF